MSVVVLDDGQVERSGGSKRGHRMRDPATVTASPGLLFGTGRRHEPVTSRELRIVRLLVRLEYRRPGERFAAQRTPERPFAGVHATVVLHVVPELKRFAAKLALERSLAGVRGQVAHQSGHVRERFAAKLAQRAAYAVFRDRRVVARLLRRLLQLQQ